MGGKGSVVTRQLPQPYQMQVTRACLQSGHLRETVLEISVQVLVNGKNRAGSSTTIASVQI